MRFKIAALVKNGPEREDSPLSRFVREASSEQKTKIYKRVLAKATARQKKVLRDAG
jgi:hypothetical protein